MCIDEQKQLEKFIAGFTAKPKRTLIRVPVKPATQGLKTDDSHSVAITAVSPDPASGPAQLSTPAVNVPAGSPSQAAP